MSENAHPDANPSATPATSTAAGAAAAASGTAGAAAAAEAPEAAVPTTAELAGAQLSGQFVKGISWFYWIGALSIVNIGMGFVGHKFIIGLGITEFVDDFAQKGDHTSIPLILLSVLISLGFMGLGFQGRKGKSAFIFAGLIIYGLDAALLVMGEDWLSVAFHAYAGFHIFKGYQALREIVKGAKAAAA